MSKSPPITCTLSWHQIMIGLCRRAPMNGVFVLDVGNSQQQNSAYFGSIQHQLDHGAVKGCSTFLLKCDIRNFDVRKIPQTQALRTKITPSGRWRAGGWRNWSPGKCSLEMGIGRPSSPSRRSTWDYLKACDDVRTTWGGSINMCLVANRKLSRNCGYQCTRASSGVGLL